MKIQKSGEDYLEAILMLQIQKGMVRSIDLAHHMGFSKPSISHAVGILKKGDYLTVDQDGYLHLTDKGQEVAENIYEKHRFFTSYFINLGVDPTQAETDACLIEHAISDESFQKMKASLQDTDEH
ncbi:MAG: metal-dependent transcriptional regulator [Lachnospiraceae bacterium]|nr:metal-dependent transcriptional regulator [Lachnospiraceae bacterium]